MSFENPEELQFLEEDDLDRHFVETPAQEPFHEDDDEIVTISVEKSVLLFWGWVGFGIAILSFYYPVLPGLGFIGLATWAIFQSSPHLGQRLASHPWVKPHLARLMARGDFSRNTKIAISSTLALVAIYIAVTEGQLALVAFGLFVGLPLISIMWGQPYRTDT